MSKVYVITGEVGTPIAAFTEYPVCAAFLRKIWTENTMTMKEWRVLVFEDGTSRYEPAPLGEFLRG